MLMLTQNEYRYFDKIQNTVKSIFRINIHILPFDHASINDTDILASCHRFKDSDGSIVKYIITVDESYIKACYNGRQTRYSRYSTKDLVETICHEIAHLFFWDHSQEHTKLTSELTNTCKKLNLF
jgi:hypothetical protein